MEKSFIVSKKKILNDDFVDFLNLDDVRKLKDMAISLFVGDHRRSKTVYEYFAKNFWGSIDDMKTINFDKSKIKTIVDVGRANNKNFVCFRPLDTKSMDDINNKDYSKVVNYSVDHDPYNSYYPISMFQYIHDNMGDGNSLEVTKGESMICIDTNSDDIINYKDDCKICTVVMFKITMRGETYYYDIIDDPSITYQP